MTDSLSKNRARKDIAELRKKIEKHNRLYYEENSPVISDFEYDRLVRSLVEIEENYPDLALPDSPSRKVGEKVSGRFKPLRHLKSMLSIDNISADGEQDDRQEKAHAFDRRVSKELQIPLSYTTQVKFDGVSASVIYENGVFARAATRGDGFVGEEITENVRTIKSVPKSFAGKKRVPNIVEVRGEVIILLDDFKKLNQEMEDSEGAAFANPRNAAAGSLRRIDSSITSSRLLNFFAWGIGHMSGVGLPDETAVSATLESWGFQTGGETRLCSDIDSAVEFCREIEKKRKTLGYDADGVVIKVNDISLQRRIGETAKYPRWCVAYKFKPRHRETVLRKITVQVGRTGVLTPVAELEPVNIGGVTVGRASLHNADFIAEKDIRVGDTVVVKRAGDVIPEVVKVVKKNRSEIDSKFFQWPVDCPSCGTPLTGDGATCRESSCPQQLKRSVAHLASRGAFNIQGLGYKTVSALVDKGMVKNIADVFALTKEELMLLDGFAERSSLEIEREINEKKKVDLGVFIYALGINNVGRQTAEILAAYFSSVEKFFAATDELISIKGVGEKTADHITGFTHGERGIELKDKMLNLGVEITRRKPSKNKEGGVAGRTFAITGKLQTRRADVQEAIRHAGGIAVSSASSKTDYLVVGTAQESSGEVKKLRDGKRNNVQIIDEETLRKMLALS